MTDRKLRAAGRRQRATALVGLLGLLFLVLPLPQAAGAAISVSHTAGAAPPPPATVCAPSGASGTTCTNTYSGNVANNATSSTPPPSVSVDQTQNLTNQMVHVSWANFTPSVNENGGIGFAQGSTDYAVGIYECRTFDPILDPNGGFGGPNGSCYSIPPGAPATAGPVNTVQTFTGSDGKGSADFQIETSVENSFLGCSDKQQCSLVVIPNWGGLPFNFPTGCTNHDLDTNGSGFGFGVDNFIGSNPCSWADRIVVPLSFAPTPTEFCPPANNQFASEGGAALERAMNQWRPAWCAPGNHQTPTFFDFNSAVDEYKARQDFLRGGQALTASTDMAIVNRPPAATDTSGSSRKFTYAPLAVSGIAIAYYVDNQQTGLPITDLTLNARLVAKLLTQSYSLIYGTCAAGQTAQSQFCDPAVAGNPVDLFHDPEFLALNPQYKIENFEPPNKGGTSVDFLPSVLSGNSDLTYELTRWIEADPDARSFLQGQPDSWNMHVNSYYKGVSYPIAQFLPLDPGWTGVPPGAPPNSAVLESMQLKWNPISGLDNVVHQLPAGLSTGHTTDLVSCSDPNYPVHTPTCKGNWNYPHDAQMPLGGRGLFAVMDQGSAGSFRFPTAKLVNNAGQAVAPTTASMTAAVNAMQTNSDKITQFANFANTDPRAYPLTMAWYAVVPTCGVASTAAQAISRTLNNVAGSAQLYGTNPGQLPPFGGYLALNDAQRAQTTAAAQSVGTQSCVSAPPDNTVSGQSGSTLYPPGPPPGGAPNGASPGGPAPSSPNGPPGGTRPPGANNKPNNASGIPLGLKGLDTGGWLGLLLPIALGVGGALALIAGCAYLLRGTGPGQALLMRFRRWLGLPPPLEEIGDAE